MRTLLLFLTLSSLLFSYCPHGCGDPLSDPNIHEVGRLITQYLDRSNFLKGICVNSLENYISDHECYRYDESSGFYFSNKRSDIDYCLDWDYYGVRFFKRLSPIEKQFSNFYEDFDNKEYLYPEFTRNVMFSEGEEIYEEHNLDGYSNYLRLISAISEDIENIFSTELKILEEERRETEKAYKLVDTYTEENQTIFSPTHYSVILSPYVFAKQILKDLDERINYINKKQKEKWDQCKNKQLDLDLVQEKINEIYATTHQHCIQNHMYSGAYFERGLQNFHLGNFAESLEDIRKMANLSNNLTEFFIPLHLLKGKVENELGLYQDAVLTLSAAINIDHKNVDLYFERAISYFELGEYEKALFDYLTMEKKNHVFDLNGASLQFSMGLTSGIVSGATRGLADFIPSICSSISGLGHGLWAFVCSPKEVSQKMLSAAESLASFLTEQDTSKILQTVVPELKELYALSPNCHQEKGRIIGSIIGKYGIEFLTLSGSKRGLKIYRKLKNANGALTLQTLAKIKKREKLQSLSTTWWKNTSPIIEELRKDGGKIGDKLYKAFQGQTLSELQARRILHQAGFKTFPKPKRIPKNTTVKISKKNGGMVYMKAGTREDQCILIRVMPGNPKSPNRLQQKPYVIQRKGNKAISKNGTLVTKNAEEAHIPLSEYKFKGW